MMPQGHARIGDALLLEDPRPEARALWQGRPALAVVVAWDAADIDPLLGIIVALAGNGSSHMCGARVVGSAADGRVAVVIERPPGIALGRVMDALGVAGGTFPYDVGCRLALWLTSMSRWMPRVDDMFLTWDGELRASPIPNRGGNTSAYVRFLSPAELRDEVYGQVEHQALAIYRAGIVLYALLAKAPPFPFDRTTSWMQVLLSITQPHRVPLLQMRPDLSAAAAGLVDAMVTTSPTPHSLMHIQRELERSACDDEQCIHFLAGVVRECFPGERATDSEFWEQAALLPTATTSAWTRLNPVATFDVWAALRRLNNNSSRTD